MRIPPSSLRAWRELKRERVADCRIFTVERSVAASPVDEQPHTFHRIQSIDWAQILPITTDGKAVLVRQYRHGAQRVTLEIPGGLIDPGEDAATAALRECLEETGYRGRAALPLGVVNPNPALFGNRLHAFYALDVELESAVQNTGTELTEAVLVPVAELEELLLAGEIDHAFGRRHVVALSAPAPAALMVDSIGRAGATEGRLVPPWYLIFFFGALAALGPLSIDAYLPGIPAMASDFGVTRRELAEHAQRVPHRLRDRSVLRRRALRSDRPQARRLHGPVGLPRQLDRHRVHGHGRRDAGVAVRASHRRRFLDGRLHGNRARRLPRRAARPAVRDGHDGAADRAARRSRARRRRAAARLGDDLRVQGRVFGLLAGRLRGAGARDAPRPSRQPVAALGVPAVLRRRAAARRRAAPADSLCDGHGLLGVVHDYFRDQLVVHLHAVLRRQPGAFFGTVRDERARLHVDESVQHVAARRATMQERSSASASRFKSSSLRAC